MIADTNKNQVNDSAPVKVGLYTLRLSLVKTVIPYSKLAHFYRVLTDYRATMYNAKRRFIHNIDMDRSPFAINRL